MPLGIYISVPFCRTKCSYCNFASDVFSRTVFERYINRVCSDMERAAETARQLGGRGEQTIDSVYLGGGTPTLLDGTQLRRLFVTISQNFEILPRSEITVECAPGTLAPAVLETLHSCGVNRISLGVQSFIDQEAASVARLHKRETVLDDIGRLREAGIQNISLDLIAGLPHQTMESWESSLADAVACGVPHVSVYMLEVDEDSRLGRELIAGGAKYHAHLVPDEDLIADFYSAACERLQAAGLKQYEISNFARTGYESSHNLKYWTRQPYLGFGVDAHSMLAEDRVAQGGISLSATRFATPDSLEAYLAAEPHQITPVSLRAALEESFFLGLRLTRGVDLDKVAAEFGAESVVLLEDTIQELIGGGLLEREGSLIRLTSSGRLLSNEVFERFITVSEAAV